MADAPAEKKVVEKKADCTATPADSHDDARKGAETKCIADAQTPNPASTATTDIAKTDTAAGSAAAAATKTDATDKPKAPGTDGTKGHKDGSDEDHDAEESGEGSLFSRLYENLGQKSLTDLKKLISVETPSLDLTHFPGEDALKKLFYGEAPAATAVDAKHPLGKTPTDLAGKQPATTDAAVVPPVVVPPLAKPGDVPVVAKPGDAPSTVDGTQPEKSTWSNITDWMATTASALTPDFIEKPIVMAAQCVADFSMDVWDDYGLWADNVFNDLGVTSGTGSGEKLAADLKAAEANPEYKSKEIEKLSNIENSVKFDAFAGDLFNASKAKGDLQVGVGSGDKLFADQLPAGVTPEDLRRMVKDGFTDEVKRAKDSKTGETIEIDANKNQRITDKNGNVTLKMADGTVVNNTKNPDGSTAETILFGGEKKGFMRTTTDAAGHTRFEANPDGRSYTQQVDLAKQVLLMDKFNVGKISEMPDAIVTALDRTVLTDETTGMIVGIDRTKHPQEVTINSPDGKDEWRTHWDKDSKSRKFFKKEGDNFVEVAEKDMPSWMSRNAKGELVIGGTTIERDRNHISQRRRNGVQQDIQADDQTGNVSTVATDTNTNGFIKLDTTPDGHSSSEDSSGVKRDFDHTTGQITGTESDGKEFKFDPKTGVFVSPELNRDEHGTVKINSTGTELHRDGSVTNAGRTMVDNAGHFGSGMEDCSGRSSRDTTVREQNRQASRLASDCASFASMVLSLRGAGPAAAGLMVSLAFMADSRLQGAKAMISMGSGIGDLSGIASMVTVSSAQGSVNDAINAGTRAVKTVCEAESHGIFSAYAKTTAIAQITGSIGLSPSAVILNLSEARQERRPATAAS